MFLIGLSHLKKKKIRYFEPFRSVSKVSDTSYRSDIHQDPKQQQNNTKKNSSFDFFYWWAMKRRKSFIQTLTKTYDFISKVQYFGWYNFYILFHRLNRFKFKGDTLQFEKNTKKCTVEHILNLVKFVTQELNVYYPRELSKCKTFFFHFIRNSSVSLGALTYHKQVDLQNK